MISRNPRTRRMLSAWFMAALLLTISTILLYASDDSVSSPKQKPNWVVNLPATSCPGSSSYTHCHRASPVLADITGDGMQEIIVATNNGHILVYRHDGSLVWQKDVAPAFGMGAGKQRIASSPAVADLDGDNRMEVVVGTGSMRSTVCTQGGVIVLDHLGNVKHGWPFLTQDDSISPTGCRDSVFATPALGDLDKDGDLEVVFGSFDKRIYAVHHNGQLVAGFPPNSNHFSRFGWNVFNGRLADTIWSSPALADINRDGFLDIVIGTDEGNFERSWSPPVGNWSCPYKEPTTNGYCGGSIYAFDRHGQILPGFPRYEYEIIQSVPALMDIDGDGRSEIFVGTGSYYYRVSSDHPTLGFRLFGMDSQGNDLPGWQGGKVVGGTVPAAPSLGDITGDGKPNIVVAAKDRRLYAWHADGRPVSGFPMTPITHHNQVTHDYEIGSNFILADFTGDGKMEIIFSHAWEIIIVAGNGQQLTAQSLYESRPVYTTNGVLWNSPAVGDLDGDGHLELVAQNSQLIVWDLPNSSARADWPMFKKNAARTSLQQPSVSSTPDEFLLVTEQGRANSTSRHLMLNSTMGTFNWRVESNQPSRISFPKTNGVVDGQDVVPVNFYIPAGLPLGENHLGDVTVKFTQGSGTTVTKTIPVRVRVMRELHQSYIAIIR